MAIYPVHSNYIVDVDIITTTSFKAGMVLMRDDNGRAIPADSQQLLNKTIQQKLGKFLGFAASDHDITGLTIIEPDTISSSWLDNNRNFQRFENLEVSHIRRSIKEHFDPNFNIDNPTDRSTVYKRGIGVYNQQGEIYITDQFNPVLHGDYGIDSSTVTTINPGDLLTFGGGVNAGKLVKVNTDSFGPDVLIVAIVEKYIPETGLLHFRQVSYGLSFTQTDIIYLDAAVNLSYPGSGLSMYDLSTSGYTYDIINGTSFVSAGSASYFNFDGTDDRIRASSVSLSGVNITILAWVWRNGPQNDYAGIVFDRNPIASGLNMAPGVGGAKLGYHWNNAYFNTDSLITVANQSWGLVSMAINSTSVTFGCNGTYNTFNNAHSSATWNSMTIGSDVAGAPTGRCWNGRISQAIMLTKTMTNAEVTAYFNLTKGRYGL